MLMLFAPWPMPSATKPTPNITARRRKIGFWVRRMRSKSTGSAQGCLDHLRPGGGGREHVPLATSVAYLARDHGQCDPVGRPPVDGGRDRVVPGQERRAGHVEDEQVGGLPGWERADRL